MMTLFNFGKISLLVVTTLMLISACEESNPEAERAGSEAAAVWLDVVDAGLYAESWSVAADGLKGQVNEESWVKTIGGMRTPLGEVLQRELTRTYFATSLAGAPDDGEYVVCIYETKYENKAEVVETVSLVKESDGAWRIGGYFIK